MKKFDIVYADPAWDYADKGHAGKRGASYKYKTTPLQDICNLPVPKIASDKAVLFMWCTMPFINKAEQVMNAWGFDYKTCAFTWVKTNKKSQKNIKELQKFCQENKNIDISEVLPFLSSLFFMGGGSYTRANPELCLLGVKKNSIKRISAGVRQLIVSPLEGHSRKPNIARERIVDLYGDVPRIELYATQKMDGWTCVGNTIDGKDMEETLLEMDFSDDED